MNPSPTLRQIYQAGKKHFQSPPHVPIQHLLDMEISEKDFSHYRLQLALQNIYRDLLKPVHITSSQIHLLDSTVPFTNPHTPSGLAGFALGLKDILYKGMTTHSLPHALSQNTGVYFGKIYIPEIEKEIVVELSQDHLKQGSYSFGSLEQKYKILEGCWVSHPLIYKTVFEHPFKTLYLLYKFIHFYSKNSNKIILFKNGLADLFASADLRKMDALKEQLQQEAKDIVQKDLLVLDAQDRFEIPNLKLDQAQEIMDFVYTELSNMLLVPQTKIRGLAPQGLNATGEYDDLNYSKTLEGLRETYLYPVLKALHIDFKVSHYDEQTQLQMLQDFANHYQKIKEAGIEDLYKNQLFKTLGLSSYIS